MDHKLHFDWEKLRNKPNKAHAKRIAGRIGYQPSQSLSPQQIADKIISGHTMVTCKLSGKKSDKNFVSQSVFCLDFD